MKRLLTSTRWGKRILVFAERLMFGGRGVEFVLTRLLRLHYASRFRRDWLWSKDGPHFFNHRIGFFDFVYGSASGGPYPYSRGFFISELLRQGDRLLDIGCGDGFFTKRFFSKRCASIDGIDIEPDAIDSARRNNGGRNIRYLVLDAVQQPFPTDCYDVVVWDGALGHFSPETTDTMLKKITQVLAKDGVFAGSESLGHEGHDHLQFFERVADLDKHFSKYFAYRAYRVVEYDTDFNPGLMRREAFWRCSNNPIRIEQAEWQIFREVAR